VPPLPPSSSWPMIEQARATVNERRCLRHRGRRSNASDRTSESHHQLALPPLPPSPSRHAREREPTSTRAAAVSVITVLRATESHPRHASDREPTSPTRATAAVVVTVTRASES
jgi:hypothetical protein